MSPNVLKPAFAPRSTGLGKDLAVRSISCTIVRVPTTRQHRLSKLAVTYQEYVIVQLQLDNGVVGLGEAATLGGPRWAEESVESIKSVIDRYLGPAVIGERADEFERMGLLMAGAASRNYAAKAAIDSALYDAVGKTLDLPASALLGGQVRDRFPVIWALASGDAGQEIEEAKDKLARREHKTFKIKVGFQPPAQEIKRLQQIRAALGPEPGIVVDVNQAWSEATAMRLLPALIELDVCLIEQPLAASNIAGMARLAKRLPVPLMVDEAAFTLQEIAHAGTIGAGSVLSLKLVKSGGMAELKRAAGVASAVGMELYGGCLLESSIGAAAHLSVFSTLPVLHWGTEHFGPRILKQDLVVNPIRFEEFEVILPSGPGLGIELDTDSFNALARKD